MCYSCHTLSNYFAFIALITSHRTFPQNGDHERTINQPNLWLCGVLNFIPMHYSPDEFTPGRIPVSIPIPHIHQLPFPLFDTVASSFQWPLSPLLRRRMERNWPICRGLGISGVLQLHHFRRRPLIRYIRDTTLPNGFVR